MKILIIGSSVEGGEKGGGGGGTGEELGGSCGTWEATGGWGGVAVGVSVVWIWSSLGTAREHGVGCSDGLGDADGNVWAAGLGEGASGGAGGGADVEHAKSLFVIEIAPASTDLVWSCVTSGSSCNKDTYCFFLCSLCWWNTCSLGSSTGSSKSAYS